MSIYNESWETYKKNYQSVIPYGKIMGLVKPYEDEIFQKLRDHYQSNLIPAFLLLLDNHLVQKHCYERAKLMAYALDGNCEVITANVDGIKYNPVYLEKYLNGELSDNYAEHCYVRHKDSDGIVWIYDTSMGYKIQEGLYEKLQKPEITSISRDKVLLEDLDLTIYNDISEIVDSLRITLDPLKQVVIPVKSEYRDLIEHEFKVLEEKMDSCVDTETKEVQNVK